MQIELFHLKTPIGRLQIACTGNKVCGVNLGIDRKIPPCWPKQNQQQDDSDFAMRVRSQFEHYFEGALQPFSVELMVTGTDYQRAVWNIIRLIKRGETRTYGDIAAQIGSSARAVGNACRANPIPIIVPCHRVVSKSGLGGFAGQREGQNMKVKTWLLEHERASYYFIK